MYLLYGDQNGGTAAASVIKACRANEIRVLECSVQKSKESNFPLTNTKTEEAKRF